MEQTTETHIGKTTVTVRGKAYTRYVVPFMDDETGKRKRKTFAQLATARRFAEQLDHDTKKRDEREKILRARIGEDAKKLSADSLRDAVAALAVLAGKGTLEAAARHYVALLERQAKSVPTVGELVQDYIQASEGEGLRDASLRELKHRLGRLIRRFGPRRVDELTGADLQQWFEGMRQKDGKRYSAASQKHYGFAVGAVFNYAIELGYIEVNPAAAKTRGRRGKARKTTESTAEIFTPDEAKALMTAAVQYAPEMVAPLGLGLFAGCRTAEIRQMTWERHIDLPGGLVQITSDIAKKRRVRNVDILPNLQRWLAAVPNRTGYIAADPSQPDGNKPMTDQQWRRRVEKVRTKATPMVEAWPYNGLRHSYGSYHLEQHGDPAKTAFQMGHADSGALLFEHYRQLCTREDAASFWKIEPPSEGDVMRMEPGRVVAEA